MKKLILLTLVLISGSFYFLFFKSNKTDTFSNNKESAHRALASDPYTSEVQNQYHQNNPKNSGAHKRNSPNNNQNFGTQNSYSQDISLDHTYENVHPYDQVYGNDIYTPERHEDSYSYEQAQTYNPEDSQMNTVYPEQQQGYYDPNTYNQDPYALEVDASSAPAYYSEDYDRNVAHENNTYSEHQQPEWQQPQDPVDPYYNPNQTFENAEYNNYY